MEKDLIEIDKKRLDIRNKYREKMIVSVNKNQNQDDFIYFPKFLVSEKNHQLRYGVSWHRNGFIIKKGKNIIAVDPGVDFVLRLSESNFNLTSITHIFISHAHLDHVANVNTLMDFLIRAKAKVQIIAPKSVFDTKTVSDFHSGLKADFPVNHYSIIIDEHKTIDLLDDYKMTFVPLVHGIECFGFKISDVHTSYTYLSDTAYSKVLMFNNEKILISNIDNYIEDAKSIDSYDYIKKFVKGSDVLIANVDSFMYTKNSKSHLSFLDLIEIVENNDVKKIVLAHIDPMGELPYERWGKKLALYAVSKCKIKAYSIEKSGKKIKI